MSVCKLRMKIGLAADAAAVCMALAISSAAQIQTQTQTTTSMPLRQVVIERGQVVAVEGNDLFVEMADGSVRHFPDIPETAKATVGGKQVGIHDLQPGMALQRAIVTTTTPQVVTTAQTVTGKVWQVTPPLSVILTLEDGKNQAFNIPGGQKFVIDGKETDAWGLKKGMTVTATKIVETPLTTVEKQVQVTGTIQPEVPVLIATK